MRTKLNLAIAVIVTCHSLMACGDGSSGARAGSGGESGAGGRNGGSGKGGQGGGSEAPLVVPAEPGTVYGIVTDIGSGAGVPGAEVMGGGQIGRASCRERVYGTV